MSAPEETSDLPKVSGGSQEPDINTDSNIGNADNSGISHDQTTPQETADDNISKPTETVSSATATKEEEAKADTDDTKTDVKERKASTDENASTSGQPGPDEHAPSSPDPEYTPPDSGASWSSKDEVNKTVENPSTEDNLPGNNPDDKPEVSQTTVDKPEVSQITDDKPEVSQVTDDKPEVSQTTDDKPEVSQTTDDKPEVSQVTDDKPESGNTEETKSPHDEPEEKTQTDVTEDKKAEEKTSGQQSSDDKPEENKTADTETTAQIEDNTSKDEREVVGDSKPEEEIAVDSKQDGDEQLATSDKPDEDKVVEQCDNLVAVTYLKSEEKSDAVEKPADDIVAGTDDNKKPADEDESVPQEPESETIKGGEAEDVPAPKTDEVTPDPAIGALTMADKADTQEEEPKTEPQPETTINQEPAQPETQPEAQPQEEAKEEEPKKDVVVVVAPAGDPMATKKLEKKIQDNEDLQLKLESALSNQAAEREAYQKMIDENAKLKKHHDDMKEKCEELEGGQMLTMAELEKLRSVNHQQQDEVGKLKSEVKMLKETQGGDENIKDYQDKLIRLANDQEEKDRRIHGLEAELDDTKTKLNDAESKAARNGEASKTEAPKSRTCAIM